MKLPFSAVILAGLVLPLSVARAESAPGPLAATLQPLVDAHTIAGAVVLLASPAKVLDVEAVGFGDLKSQRTMKPDDVFWIASMSKAMTASGLLMLVDEGKVALDDPVAKFLPAFQEMKVKTAPAGSAPVLVAAEHAITVREILSHSAGLDFKSPFEGKFLDQHTLADRVASYAAQPLLWEPGTRYKYANEGLNTAGRIIEVVSGEPYEKFMQERLFDPLGMTETTFFPSAGQVARLATSYQADAAKTGLEPTVIDQLTYPLDGPGRYPMPAGGLFSTAQDVGNFCQMVANHGVWEGKRILSEASWQAMTTRQTPPGQVSYGFGLMVDADGVGHDGAYKTMMRIDLRRGLIVVLLVQQNRDWPNGLKKLNVVVTAAAEKAFAPAP